MDNPGPGDFGYRTRLGASGFDPVDQAMEQGRFEGNAIKFLFTGSIRSRNPVARAVLWFSFAFCAASTVFLIQALIADSLYGLLTAIAPLLVIDLLLIRSLYARPSPARRRRYERRDV